jgi:hypothetical protein
MLASRIARLERQGIVLVLVLAMLGLLALIGVTFATFSSQARINARNYAQSMLEPQDDELMDFALAQLINDTGDPRSVIHGHSLARDMYGNDANNNGYLTYYVTNNTSFYITGVAQSTFNGALAYQLTTNIIAGDANYFGYNFTRWLMRVSYNLSATSPFQTLEILADSGYSPGSAAYRTFTVAPFDSTTTLTNATQGTTAPLPGAYLASLIGIPSNSALTSLPFVLDGRWLHAFGGPGMGAKSTPINITLNGTTTTYQIPNSVYGNFRYNGTYIDSNGNVDSRSIGVTLNGPGAPSMDEDYDACDLENWFLALQSADGQVMIPSFHRPANIRYDPNNPTTSLQVNDWTRTNLDLNGSTNWFTSASRILRPVKADGHDAATFPDLVPDPNTGKITYDVDNDGDGVTDSVWLDLGYPARRNGVGKLYKPLFAFMVIGLNGRLPLNTAGNLAGTAGAAVTGSSGGTPVSDGSGAIHSLHLGNSTSEIDITYALQNAYNSSTTDPTLAFLPPPTALSNGNYVAPAFPGNANYASNSQVDTGGIDVRLTQLRNLLAGTRPQNNPYSPDTSTNGELDYVLFDKGLGAIQQPYFMPNGIAESGIDSTTADPNTGAAQVYRTTAPVPGRWGEAQSIPGLPFPNPAASGGNSSVPAYVNVVSSNYTNPVRAGYSLDISDILNGVPRDAADDNFNAFDPYPIGHTGEVGDADSYDVTGASLLPVERIRRWLTPADINGTGRVHQWNVAAGGPDRGGDPYGRVEYQSYFRPAGAPGAIETNGVITFGTINAGVSTAWTSGASYVPDVTNNLTHGFESFRYPNQTYMPPGFTPQNVGGAPSGGSTVPATENVGANGAPTAYPTYDYSVNSIDHSDGVNEADELNIYQKNPLLDSPYAAPDLEWLYRQQDVDGAALTSRLQYLAPISMTNAIDGQRRRRLFALDSMEMNNFVWTNDNPGNTFPTNHRFTTTQSASVTQLSNSLGSNNGFIATPSLAHRDKKINLNYPLPVSNDPNEPIRHKWISDTYQFLKLVLPPRAVDTPEELAQLSQFVINIIDFRDPDATMTHWTNPDVYLSGVLANWTVSASPGTVTGVAAGTATSTGVATAATPVPQLMMIPSSGIPSSGAIPLDQYGMEYNPVAINEALMYSFSYQTSASGGTPATTANRFFIELVNTLTMPEIPNSATSPYTNSSVLDLGGFQYTLNDPYSGGSWDIMFTADDPYSRPDPYRGDLSIFGNFYALTPLNKDSFSSTYPGAAAAISSDVILQPLLPSAAAVTVPSTATPSSTNTIQPASTTSTPAINIPAPSPGTPSATPAVLPTNYFYVFGNLPPSTSASGGGATTYYEYDGTTPGGLQPGLFYASGGGATATAASVQTGSAPATAYTGSNGWKVPLNTPAVIQSLNTSGGFDPFTGTKPATVLYPGVLPGIAAGTQGTATAPPACYVTDIPSVTPTSPSSGTQRPTKFIWVCLRRPADPFAPVSATNPMLVVDSMRVPYIDGTGATTTQDANNNPAVTGTFNTIYSAQRFQPYRGGHAVPMLKQNLPTTVTTIPPVTTIDTRYGFTEQLVPPSASSTALKTQGIYYSSGSTGSTLNSATLPILHTLGWANESEMGSGMSSTTSESWDFFPFHDRDYTSVAELMFVPSCPPGLFTKQFTEFAPSQYNIAAYFTTAVPQYIPGVQPLASGTAPTATTVYTKVVSGALGKPASATANLGLAPGGLTGTALTSGPFVSAYANASVPVNSVNSVTSGSGATATNVATAIPHSIPYLSDKFYYSGFGGTATIDTASSTVGGYAADGWFKMFDLLEVPTQMFGGIGPVASGINFDWARQDSKPGLLNINLIIDEEVYLGLLGKQSVAQQNGQLVASDGSTTQIPSDQFAQQHLNMDQVQVEGTSLPAGAYTPYGTAYTTASGPPYLIPLPTGAPPVPLVVTATAANGSPTYTYPLPSTGLLAADPIVNNGVTTGATYTNGLKASFVQFLNLRHGGSGYMFGFGTAAVGQNLAVTPTALASTGAPNNIGIPAEIPFHSLTYPDIDHTIMRPAALPPTAYTNPAPNSPPILAPPTGMPVSYYAGDPGVRNPNVFIGSTTGTAPGAVVSGMTATFNPVYPPAVPARRLFQMPDAFTGYTPATSVTNPVTGAVITTVAASNASESGDPFINNTSPVIPTGDTAPTVPLPSIGALPPVTLGSNTAASGASAVLTDSVPNLYWANGSAATVYPSTGGSSSVSLPGSVRNPYLGANSTTATGPAVSSADNRQHPYWRLEDMQRVMNLTTVRTHQYAVWITIGFFEVTKQGDLNMLNSGSPQLAYDTMGPEIGIASNKSARFRGFFLVDRTQLIGFNPGNTGSFRNAVVYRKVIQ